MVISFKKSPGKENCVVEMDIQDFINLTNLISETAKQVMMMLSFLIVFTFLKVEKKRERERERGREKRVAIKSLSHASLMSGARDVSRRDHSWSAWREVT